MNKSLLNLQQFAASDLNPAISVDFNTRLVEGIESLQAVLGITEMLPMAQGTVINSYKINKKAGTVAQVAEGVDINLHEFERTLAWSKTLGLKKYRKQTGAESIQKVGYDKAVNQTDAKLVSEVQKDIKSDFFTGLGTGTTVTGTRDTLQKSLAALWGKLQVRFEDYGDVSPVFFINPNDVSDYLATASITTQTAFGFQYVENFLGLGLAILTTSVTAGSPKATVTQNLNGAYVPAGGDVASSFGLTMDQTGMVGMTHSAITRNATIETLVMAGVIFYPEYADGVFVASFTKA